MIAIPVPIIAAKAIMDWSNNSIYLIVPPDT